MAAPDTLLKTRQVAQALGVSVSTIKRWVDLGELQASRTVGKHRLIRSSEALRFARTQGLPHMDLELLVGIGVTQLDAIDDRARAGLLDALRLGKSEAARALIRSAYASVRDGVVMADELIRPVVEQIGHGWMTGTLDVFQEHQATQVVAAAIHELIDTAATSREGPSQLALGGAPEGDPYVLPGLLAELILLERGWEVRNLGVNLPLTSLANAVREYRPRLVFLTVGYLPDDRRFVREYDAFYETAAEFGAAVILGGRALGPEIRSRLMYTSFGDRMAHLAELVRRILPTTTAAPAEETDGLE